jgi:phenylacetate-CoA ligase
VGEYFSEGFREMVASRFGHPPDSPFCVWTGYGSADAGDLGVETASTVALRKFFFRRPALSLERFGTEETPMLLAPNPEAHIEVVGGNLVVTKDQLVPLVRFDTGDAGSIVPREEFTATEGMPDGLVASLPERVLAVFGRAGDAVIFYGTNLLVGEISGHFLSLPPERRYGGLFELRRGDRGGVTIYSFTVFVRGDGEDSLRAAYEEELIRFLKERSLEFAAKYDALSRSVGEPLIRVELKDVATAPGGIKHRYIVEE